MLNRDNNPFCLPMENFTLFLNIYFYFWFYVANIMDVWFYQTFQYSIADDDNS